MVTTNDLIHNKKQKKYKKQYGILWVWLLIYTFTM